jgi:short-subunit dehydrogenase
MKGRKMKSGEGRALITGASSGIGRALAERFASERHDVVLASRNRSQLLELAADLRARHGVEAEAVPIDLSEPGAAARLVQACPRIDFLVNNAGSGLRGAFLQSDPAREEAMLRLNLNAVVELTRALAPGMVERGFGRILNVASTAAFQPGPMMAVYAAGKSFLLGFGQALGWELRNTGVTVTTLCPGPTASGFNAAAGVPETALVRMALMRPERVAAAGYLGMRRGKSLVIPGFWNAAGAWLAAVTPRGLMLKAMGALQGAVDASP